MQVDIAENLAGTALGKTAERILRTCVHCGFCNATCPTYQLLGDEQDGPRGRIYQIKSLLEGSPATVYLQTHLDRCLTCRACETTCPSGVRYGRLLDMGRGRVEREVSRPLRQRLLRRLVCFWVPYPARLRPFYRLAQRVRFLLPAGFRSQVEPVEPLAPWPIPRHRRRMLVLDGCVQQVVAKRINLAAAQVFDRLGISLIRLSDSGCCGALSYHMGMHTEGLDFMRRNIDAWWPEIEKGIEAIVITASGCGVTIKEYGELLADDPDYAAKAARIAALAKDVGEILAEQPDLDQFVFKAMPRITFQSPCTLQHGQRLNGLVEGILQRLGAELVPVMDSHSCCGSAGAYSLFQPRLSRQLRDQKIGALEEGEPDMILTANIGCLLHLKSVASRPVKHWIEHVAASG